jgi:hypothetical protein
MKHLLLIILSFFLLSSPVIGQSKPLGVVLPPTVMGNVSNSRKQILLNTLDEEVSKYFDVSPSTNDGSVKLPVVSDIFQLQIIEEDGDTQLSLRWTSGDERRVETQYCEGCKTIELNRKLEGLVGKLFGGEGLISVKNNIVNVNVKGKGILFRDTPYSKFLEGGKKWFKTGNIHSQVRYEGEIENGVPNGYGSFTSPIRDKYIGEFKDGVINGQGTYIWSNGGKYVGEWMDGKINGYGTQTLPDGSKYVGEFKNWEYHGHGTRTLRDGGYFRGEWKYGGLWNGTGYHKGGKFDFRMVNGEPRTY